MGILMDRVCVNRAAGEAGVGLPDSCVALDRALLCAGGVGPVRTL